MNYDERKIQDIVTKVVAKLAADPAVASMLGGGAPRSHASSAGPTIHVPRASAEGRNGIFGDIDSAVQAARVAHERLVRDTSIDVRQKAIEACRAVTVQHAADLAQRAVAETGLGRVADKINKNKLAALKTPGMEALKPSAHTGDFGLALDERAPYGVIASITPCTNATETIINNAIGMLAGGNGVVFNVHPTAKETSVHFIRLLNQAMTAVGAPDNIFCCITEPTIESASQVMKHPLTRIVVVTGGPAVVKAAMATGKKVIGAGPGNPPVVVDETAHLGKAARHIIDGASLDNNVVCIVEKEIFAVAQIADRLKDELVRAGAYLMNERQVQQLESIMIEDGHVAKRFVGKNANVMLREIGVDVGDDVRIAFGEVHENHPFVQIEMLSPIIPFVRVPNVDAAIDAAVRAEHGYFHTSVMHSTNIDHLDRMAKAVNTSLFIKNGPSYAGLGMGGEGFTSWTIAGPTGEGLTTAYHFTRMRRCTLVDHFRIV
jgi:acyl-CoA reductase-like NAD-dependent aldehyde dehydrogenase